MIKIFITTTLALLALTTPCFSDDHKHDEQDWDDREFPGFTEVEEFLEKNLPIYAEWLNAAKEENWMEYCEGVEKAGNLFMEYQEMAEHNEGKAKLFLQLHKLVGRIDRLTHEWHEAGGAKKDETKNELRESVGELFDIEQDLNAAKIDMLRQEIEDHEAKIAEEKEKREAIVNEELKDRLRGAKGE
jgi:hypothetical protein